MYTVNTVDTEDFILFEIIDENGDKTDSVSITKYTPQNVVHFYRSDEEYIEECSSKLREIIDRYDGKLNFLQAMEAKDEAEFSIYTNVKGLR